LGAIDACFAIEASEESKSEAFPTGIIKRGHCTECSKVVALTL
jgi:hypothetical protein